MSCISDQEPRFLPLADGASRRAALSTSADGMCMQHQDVPYFEASKRVRFAADAAADEAFEGAQSRAEQGAGPAARPAQRNWFRIVVLVLVWALVLYVLWRLWKAWEASGQSGAASASSSSSSSSLLSSSSPSSSSLSTSSSASSGSSRASTATGTGSHTSTGAAVSASGFGAGGGVGTGVASFVPLPFAAGSAIFSTASFPAAPYYGAGAPPLPVDSLWASASAPAPGTDWTLQGGPVYSSVNWAQGTGVYSDLGAFSGASYPSAPASTTMMMTTTTQDCPDGADCARGLEPSSPWNNAAGAWYS